MPQQARCATPGTPLFFNLDRHLRAHKASPCGTEEACRREKARDQERAALCAIA